MLDSLGKPPAAEFETGSLTIALMQSDAFGPRVPAAHTHPIALHVEDVAAARAELEAYSVSFPETIDSGVCHMAHFQDPNGNALMLHHRHAPRPALTARSRRLEP